MTRFRFEDDLSLLDLRKTSVHDLQANLSYADIKLRSGFQSKFLKEQNAIHQIGLALEKLDNHHYETIRECKRRLHEIELQIQDKREAQDRERHSIVLETARRTKEMEDEINAQSREHEMTVARLEKRKSTIRSDHSSLKQQIGDSKALHHTRVTQLRDALEEFRAEIRLATQRKQDLDGESGGLNRTLHALEAEFVEVTAQLDSTRAGLQSVATDLRKMREDYNELRATA
jgi:chromosome segregation ATPase